MDEDIEKFKQLKMLVDKTSKKSIDLLNQALKESISIDDHYGATAAIMHIVENIVTNVVTSCNADKRELTDLIFKNVKRNLERYENEQKVKH